MTKRPGPIAWIAFLAFVGSVIGSLFGGYSRDLTAPMIRATVGALIGLLTANR